MTDYTKTAIKAGVAAAVAVLAIGLVGQVFDVSMMAATFGSEETEIPVPFAAIQALVVTIIGAFAARAIFINSPTPSRAYRVLALVAFVTISGMAVAGAADVGTTVVLLTMHVAVLVPTMVWLIPALGDLNPPS